MKAYDFIETKSLLITLAIRFFSNKYIYIVFDIVITTLIAMHTENINIESQEWWKTLGVYILVFIVYNFLYLWMDHLGSKRDKVHKFVAHSYMPYFSFYLRMYVDFLYLGEKQLLYYVNK